MHDLLRDYARRQLAEIPNVDSNATDTQELIRNKHKAFLARCRQACAGGRWSRLPEDPYLSNQILWHAEQAGEIDTIHQVLNESDDRPHARSEEHTSELQSLMRNSYAVFCLKKKNKIKQTVNIKYKST